MNRASNASPNADEFARRIRGRIRETTRCILDVGCGAAAIIEPLAREFPAHQFVGLDVDAVQLKRNTDRNDLANVCFLRAAAQAIPLPDRSVQLVVMNKSLHHLPHRSMQKGLSEAHRVLEPGCSLLIFEPVYAGTFNQVLKVFHDEREVRQQAIRAIEQAVAAGQFASVEREVFMQHRYFESFTRFRDLVIDVSHTEFDLSKERMAQVAAVYQRFAASDGSAELTNPVRYDRLVRRSADV